MRVTAKSFESDRLAPDGVTDRPRDVSKPQVHTLHGLVALLGPGDDLPDAMPGGPRELVSLHGGSQAATPPRSVDDGQTVLGPRVVIVPGDQACVADDPATGQRHDRSARQGRFVAKPFLE